MKKRMFGAVLAAGMMVSIMALNVQAAENFTVTPTTIIADGVVNQEGYGAIRLNDSPIWQTESSMPGIGGVLYGGFCQYGLIDRSGNVLFPYIAGEYRYRVIDGVISYSYEGGPSERAAATMEGVRTLYYDLNGNLLFDQLTLPETLPETLPDWMDSYNVDEPARAGYYCSPMEGGFAVVEIGEDTGFEAFIDRTGRVTCFTADLYYNQKAEGYWERMKFSYFGDNGWVAYSVNNEAENANGLIGYMDGYGQEMLNVKHLNLLSGTSFEDGLAVVTAQDCKMGAIDTSGNFVIPCIYEELISCPGSAEILCAKQDGKWGYIDRTGQTVIPLMYDAVYGWADGVGAVKLNDKCGLVDAGNNVVLPMEYDDISDFTSGVCYAVKDKIVYIITR